MIAKREKWLAAHKRKPPVSPFEIVHEHAAADISDVLLLLGIASQPNDPAQRSGNAQGQLLLEPWAVKAALARSRKRVLAEHDITHLKRCTRDPESVT